jgi:hypothetical protein
MSKGPELHAEQWPAEAPKGLAGTKWWITKGRGRKLWTRLQVRVQVHSQLQKQGWQQLLRFPSFLGNLHTYTWIHVHTHTHTHAHMRLSWLNIFLETLLIFTTQTYRTYISPCGLFSLSLSFFFSFFFFCGTGVWTHYVIIQCFLNPRFIWKILKLYLHLKISIQVLKESFYHICFLFHSSSESFKNRLRGAGGCLKW